ncbi:hypothetical protein ABEB36_012170 [Hypothenemus hampei]|uniref:Uncharacterized protein n=1 Tax=Hypothenemus hampei TaxID=57062 RepID=A0ABD1EAC7_HYPHA
MDRRSLDFDSLLDCYENDISASTEEILWSDDETIVAEQEHIWNEGTSEFTIEYFLFKFTKRLLVPALLRFSRLKN